MEALFIVIAVIATVSVLVYFLRIETPEPIVGEIPEQVKKCSSLYSRFEKKIDSLRCNTKQVFLFKDVEFSVAVSSVFCDELAEEYVYAIPPRLYVNRDDSISLSERFLYHKSFTCYKDEIDWKTSFIEDFIKEAVVHTPYREQLSSLLDPYVLRGNWVEVGEGSYYSNNTYGVYRFSDWDLLCGKAALEAIQGLSIKVCENPLKTYWKHFLELDMKAKKQREVDCKVFIDSILSKQQEYNDLQLKYEMLPSAPIKDYESFSNFCKIVKEPIKFENYEITNMLLLKRNELGELK